MEQDVHHRHCAVEGEQAAMVRCEDGRAIGRQALVAEARDPEVVAVEGVEEWECRLGRDGREAVSIVGRPALAEVRERCQPASDLVIEKAFRQTRGVGELDLVDAGSLAPAAAPGAFARDARVTASFRRISGVSLSR